MTRSPSRPFALVLLSALAVALALWFWWQHDLALADEGPPLPSPTAEAARQDAAKVATDAANPAAAPAAAPSATAAERTAADPTAAAGTGSVLVHVQFADHTPAPAIAVALGRRGVDAMFDEPRARSDASGDVLFRDQPPGRVYAHARMDYSGAGARVEIAAGRRTECTLTLSLGMDCTVRVIDAQKAPVPDARIVASGWGGGEIQDLGTTGADGTFAIRGLPTHGHLGARKAGFLPSPQRQFTVQPGSKVDFTIVLEGPGGALTGTVLDPQERPVAGAVVRAGANEQKLHKLPDGAPAMAPQPETTRTDAQGHFRFEGLPTGPVPIAARARGLASWQHDVELRAGVPESVTIRLPAGASLTGTVRDAAGKPIAGVDVQVGDWRTLGEQSLETGADGTFHFLGLDVGTLSLRAGDDEHGHVEAKFDFAPGEAKRWDPVLDPGLCVRGRVVDADGKVVARTIVEAQVTAGTRTSDWFGFADTDDAGRFTLKNCQADWRLRITFRRKSTFPELVLPGVQPGGDELLVTLPKEAWIWIQGTVLGPDDQPVPNVHASPFVARGSGSPAESVDPATGAFRYGPYPPGRYSLRFETAGFPTLRVPEHDVAPNEVWDLGVLHFVRGGTLVAQFTAPVQKATLYDDAGRRLQSLDVKDGVARSELLPPGNYQLQVASDGWTCRPIAFEVRADRETRLDVAVGKGNDVAIRCEVPGADDWTLVAIVVKDTSGIVVWRGQAWSTKEGVQAKTVLAPGEYVVEGTSEGWSGTAKVTVGDAAGVVVTLK